MKPLQWKYSCMCLLMFSTLQFYPGVFCNKKKTNITLLLVDRLEFALNVADYAINSINENENILPTVQLQIHQQVSLGSSGNEIRDVFLRLAERTDVTAIFGPTSSGDIPIINQIAVKRSILQVNYNALQDTFSNKRIYPYLFNSCQLYSAYESALTDILFHYDWKKIGMIYQIPDSVNELIFYEFADNFERHIRKKGITDISVSTIPFERDLVIPGAYKEFTESLKQLKAKDIRIIVTFMNRIPLRFLFCEAFQLGMYGPKYMFLVGLSHDFEDWYKPLYTANSTRCRDEDLLIVAESAIFLDRLSSADDHVTTVSNKTVGEIWRSITNDRTKERRYLYLYDGIWAFALSLHKVLQTEPTFAETVNMNVENRTRLNMLAEKFENIQFQGASGEFNYIKENGKRYRLGDLVLRRYKFVKSSSGRSGKGIFISLGRIGASGTFLNNVSKLRKYVMPLDRPKVLKYIIKYPNVLTTIVWIFCGCGISIAALFLLTNVIYRNLKFIKLSSPNINNLICIGCIILYAAVILYGLDTNTVDIGQIANICNATVLLLSMGFTLTFGALFSKTWRIYRIFTRSRSLRSAVIRDIHLFSIVFALLLVDLIVFCVWIGISPYQLKEKVTNTVENKTLDIIEKDVYHHCESKHQSIFLSVLFAYKGLLMLFGLFVAYETRSIAVEAINDAKYIGFAVYNVALFITLSSILVYTIHDTNQHQVVYGVFAFGIFETTTITMLLVFIPKINMIMHEDYEDPNFKNGRPVMKSSKKSVNYSENYSDRKTSS